MPTRSEATIIEAVDAPAEVVGMGVRAALKVIRAVDPSRWRGFYGLDDQTWLVFERHPSGSPVLVRMLFRLEGRETVYVHHLIRKRKEAVREEVHGQPLLPIGTQGS